jgi:hypothetical protein
MQLLSRQIEGLADRIGASLPDGKHGPTQSRTEWPGPG